MTEQRIDKQHRYPWAVIETAIQFYNQEGMTFRLVSEKMLQLGVVVSHKTVYEWVEKFNDNVKPRNSKRVPSYEVEESYVKCNGEFKFMYRAVDRKNATLSVYLQDKKALAKAKAFFKKHLDAK